MRRASVPAGVLPFLAAGVGTVLGAGAAFLSVAQGDAGVGAAALHAVCVLGLVWSGAFAWRRRPTSLTGPLLVLAGAGLAPLPLALVPDEPALRALALHTAGWFAPPLAHLLVGFPSGRLVRRGQRLAIAYVYAHTSVAWSLVLLFYVPGSACTGCADGPWIGLLGDREAFQAVNGVHVAASLALAGYVAGTLVGRFRRATPAARRVFAPIRAAGVVTAVVFTTSAVFLYRLLDGHEPPVAVEVLWAVGWLAVPAATVLGLLRMRTTRFDLNAVVRGLDADLPPLGLRDALARALGDPTVELGFWVPDVGDFRDVHGRPLALPHPAASELGGGRAATPLRTRSGHRTRAVLVHDAALLEDDGLLDAVAAAAGFALENERLHAEVRARLEEVQGARARLVEAEDAARRRIERDLHDGAQQTLVSLALALRMLGDALHPEEDAAAHAIARRAALLGDEALEELRELARGVFPAVLHLDGLVPALEDMSGRSPLPVRLDLAVEGRPDPAVEAAAYYVCREAVRNAIAVPGHRELLLSATGDGTRLVVCVHDPGAVRPVRSLHGLHQLEDRVSALGGRLHSGSSGGGITVRAELPYAASASASASAPAESWSLRTNGSPLSRSRAP